MLRFVDEAKLAAKVAHDSAVQVHDLGWEPAGGLLWIAMERVDSTALNRWLDLHGPMPLEQFVPFFERLAEAVQTAHERGVVHRDLKPANMMVVERAGRLLPKLLDFGIAKLLGVLSDSQVHLSGAGPRDAGDRDSARGAAVGSPPYIAPEQ